MTSMGIAGHINNTLDRITVAMGEVPGRAVGEQIIHSIVADTAFAGCVTRAETQIAKAHPLLRKPFLRNDERQFLIAQFPLHHTGYDVA